VDAVCFRVSAPITGWICANFTGRTVTVNGEATSCGAAMPNASEYRFEVTAGAYAYASISWW
jgi:endoglucanase